MRVRVRACVRVLRALSVTTRGEEQVTASSARTPETSCVFR